MNMRSLLPGLWPPGNGSSDPLAVLRHEVDRAFESFGRSMPSFAWPQDAAAPKINVTRRDKVLEISAELPGVDLKDVELLVDDDTLTIRGEKRQEKEDTSAERHVHECSYGAFSRTISLPFEADAKTVTAGFRNGVLTVAIPIPPEVQPKAKRIEIRPEA
jgi:HSP20 family protein